MNKVDQLNRTVLEVEVNNTALAEKVKVMEKTVVELQENNTALADKSTALADKVNKIEGTILAPVSNSKLAFSNSWWILGSYDVTNLTMMTHYDIIFLLIL